MENLDLSKQFINRCVECGGVFSKKIGTCPHCGCPNPLLVSDGSNLSRENDEGYSVKIWIKRMVFLWVIVGALFATYSYFEDQKRKREDFEWTIENASEGLSGQPYIIKFERDNVVSEMRTFINTPETYPRSLKQYQNELFEIYKPFLFSYVRFEDHVKTLRESGKEALIPEGCSEVLSDPIFRYESICREAGVTFEGE